MTSPRNISESLLSIRSRASGHDKKLILMIANYARGVHGAPDRKISGAFCPFALLQILYTPKQSQLFKLVVGVNVVKV